MMVSQFWHLLYNRQTTPILQVKPVSPFRFFAGPVLLKAPKPPWKPLGEAEQERQHNYLKDGPYATWWKEIPHPVCVGVSKNRGTPKWMVNNGNPIKMDDLGVPLFLETPV